MKNFNDMDKNERMVIILIVLCIALCFLVIKMTFENNDCAEDYNDCTNIIKQYKIYYTENGEEEKEDEIKIFKHKI